MTYHSFILNALSTEITTQPADHTTVLALNDVTLSCSASIDDVTYLWHRVGDILPTKSKVHHSGTFTIRKATPYDEGMYYCTASKDGVIVSSDNAAVQVDGKGLYNSDKFYNVNVHTYIDQLNVIVMPSGMVTLYDRETAHFNATASGLGEENLFVYQWKKRGNSGLPDEVLASNKIVLVISNLSKPDEGDYYCTVTNEWNRTVESNVINLHVKGKNHALFNKCLVM